MSKEQNNKVFSATIFLYTYSLKLERVDHLNSLSEAPHNGHGSGTETFTGKETRSGFVSGQKLPPLPFLNQNGTADTYVKLKVENQRFKTKVIKKCLTPSWCEEFSFKVEDLKEQLVVTLLNDDKYFIDDVIGSVKIPVARVFDSGDKSLGTLWYPLQPKKRSKIKECGNILISRFLLFEFIVIV
ncbi:C2 and GRAM domain-containing protein [Tanacetum coccineum]